MFNYYRFRGGSSGGYTSIHGNYSIVLAEGDFIDIRISGDPLVSLTSCYISIVKIDGIRGEAGPQGPKGDPGDIIVGAPVYAVYNAGTSTQSVASPTTIVNFGSVEQDPLSIVTNAGTDWKAIIPVDRGGLYAIESRVTTSGGTLGGDIGLQVLVNTTPRIVGVMDSSAGRYREVSGEIYLNAGDEIQIAWYSSGSSASNLSGIARENRVSIVKLDAIKGDQGAPGDPMLIDSLNIGMIMPFAGTTAPDNFLMCDGSAVSRATYAALYNVVGTYYGNGDGVNTFNLPNLQGKVPVGKSTSGTFVTLGSSGGEETHTLSVTEMPAHTHNHVLSNFNVGTGTGNNTGYSEPIENYPYFHTSSTGGGAAHNNIQPYQVINYVIKYAPTATTALDAAMPKGTILEFAGTTAPDGFLLCNGAAVSRATYAGLFNVIGVTYGSGDGINTFNLPNRRDKFGIGAGGSYSLNAQGGETTHQLTVNEMPSHTHKVPTVFNSVGNYADSGKDVSLNYLPLIVTSSAGGDAAHNNMPPYIALNYMIKY